MNEGCCNHAKARSVGEGGGRGTSFMPLHTKLLGDVTSRKGIPGKGKARGG